MILDESPTSTNLGNDHGFIIEEYYLHWYEAFWVSPKQSHESLCSKRTISYHCGESCSSNMVSEPCPKLSYTKDSKRKGVERELRLLEGIVKND